MFITSKMNFLIETKILELSKYVKILGSNVNILYGFLTQIA
jgi:hypothetical protein